MTIFAIAVALALMAVAIYAVAVAGIRAAAQRDDRRSGDVRRKHFW